MKNNFLGVYVKYGVRGKIFYNKIINVKLGPSSHEIEERYKVLLSLVN